MTEIRMLDIAEKAARAAGSMLMSHFGIRPLIQYKDAHNIVTAYDNEAETIILNVLRRHFARHSFFSEEIGLIPGDSDFLWVIDPLDGTTNFAQGIPHFCVSIAFYYKKIPSVAVVYSPVFDELFVAESGSGAYLNGNKIGVRPEHTLEKAIIVINRAAEAKEKARAIGLFSHVAPRVRTVRAFGATALDLCYIACGRIDAMINCGCEHYDCAAGNLIAMEAGGLITDFHGTPWKLEKSDILVANPSLHQSLLEVLLSQFYTLHSPQTENPPA